MGICNAVVGLYNGLVYLGCLIVDIRLLYKVGYFLSSYMTVNFSGRFYFMLFNTLKLQAQIWNTVCFLTFQ